VKKFYVLLIAAALLAACGDESSSSAPASDSSEESSSSIEMTNESSSSTTVKNSSSSVGGDKSSSSVKKEDSSSSVEIASSSSATPKSSSSEEVKQSSSSVVASSSSVTSSETVKSSSSEYEPYNHYADLGSTVVSKSEYKQFTDSRNGRSYYYLTIDGVDKDGNPASVTVFAENLNIGVMVDGDKDQTNDLEIERYCYDNDTTNCDQYGGLYQWAEMMKLSSECNTKSCANLIKPNHQGICPDGWRLFTSDDFIIVYRANGNKHGVEDIRATSFGGYNNSGFSMLGAGYNWSYEFKRLTEGTYWFYPEEGSSVALANAGYQTKSMTGTGSQGAHKTHGFSVRCVKVE
jgi:uncharacterized protein (TIGR02145 family)